MTIWFASGNKNKKRELLDILSSDILSSDILSSDILSSDILSGKDWELKIPAEAGLEFGPEETGSSFFENAMIKAQALYRLLEERRLLQPGDPIIADDSGICVDALDGRPGIHSAYYGGDGLGAAERNALLLSELGDNPLRSARFVCAMLLYYGPDRFYAAQESMEGEIVKSAKGSGGFGYDPILFIPSFGRSVAELSDEEKNLNSHRGKAARAIGRLL